MHKGARTTKVVPWLIAAICLLPGAAWAGQKVISGQESLQIKVSASPAKVGKVIKTFRLQTADLSTKPGGQQPPYSTKSITFTVPKGFVINRSATPQCLESAIDRAKGDASAACPASSKIGTGSVVVNARPTVASLITGSLVAYNASNDNGLDGFSKHSGAIVLYIKTSIGVKTADTFHIVKTSKGFHLTSLFSKPTKPGVSPGSFTIQKLVLTVSSSAKRPYFTAPPTCRGSWGFALTLAEWFGRKPFTAQDNVKCSK